MDKLPSLFMKCQDFDEFARRFNKASDMIAELDHVRSTLDLSGLYYFLSRLIEENPGFYKEYWGSSSVVGCRGNLPYPVG